MSQDLPDLPAPHPDRPPVKHPSVGLDTSHVTVVLPTYNRKDMLRRCVDALLASHVEGMRVDVRIVDDGSTDGTREVVEEIIRDYRGPMNPIYHYQENGGHSKACNTGIQASTTDLILIIDDDCEPHPDWIRIMVNAPWQERTGAVGGRLVGVDSSNWVARYCRFLRYNEFPMDDKPIKFVNSASSCYPRKVLLEMNGFEEQICLGGEDIELSWRMILAGYELHFQPEAIVYHYHRETPKALYKTFVTRGYARTLRNIMWGSGRHPKWNRWTRECWLLFLWGFNWVKLPLTAHKFRKKGVAVQDCFAFAFLDWIQAGAIRYGKAQCYHRILTGKQSVQRTSHVPEGTAYLWQAPSWAKRNGKLLTGRSEDENRREDDTLAVK